MTGLLRALWPFEFGDGKGIGWGSGRLGSEEIDDVGRIMSVAVARAWSSEVGGSGE